MVYEIFSVYICIGTRRRTFYPRCLNTLFVLIKKERQRGGGSSRGTLGLGLLPSLLGAKLIGVDNCKTSKRFQALRYLSTVLHSKLVIIVIALINLIAGAMPPITADAEAN